MIFILKQILYGVLLSYFDRLFDAPIKFAPGAQALLPSLPGSGRGAHRVKWTRVSFKKSIRNRNGNLSLIRIFLCFSISVLNLFAFDLSGNSTAAIMERRAENVSRAAKSRLNVVDHRSTAEAPAFKRERDVYPEVSSKVYRRYLLRALALPTTIVYRNKSIIVCRIRRNYTKTWFPRNAV